MPESADVPSNEYVLSSAEQLLSGELDQAAKVIGQALYPVVQQVTEATNIWRRRGFAGARLSWEAEHNGAILAFLADTRETYSGYTELHLRGYNLDAIMQASDESPTDHVWFEITAVLDPDNGALTSLVIKNDFAFSEKALATTTHIHGIDKPGPWPKSVLKSNTVEPITCTAHDLLGILQPVKDGEVTIKPTIRTRRG